MADNTTVKNASGTTVTVRTIDNGGIQLPVHTLSDSSGVSTIQIDTAGRIPLKMISTITNVTLTLDTAAYADGDLMADTQEVANCFPINSGTGVLNTVTVIDEDDQGQPFDLVFLDSNNTLGSENVPPTISDTNARAVLGWVPIKTTDYIDLGGVRVATISGLSLNIKANTGNNDMYVAAISRGTGTYTASGVLLRIGVTCD